MELGTGDVVVVLDRFARQLGGTIRDGVNAGALACTEQARRNYRQVLGASQRLSGYRYTPKGTKTQPRRVNPYYREATSSTHPQAIVAVRGPAQLVEHPRKGGYTIRPRGNGVVSPTLAAMVRRGELTARNIGVPRPAMRTPRGPRADVKPGPANHPPRPFLRMVPQAPRLIEEAARKRVQTQMDEVARRVNRFTSEVVGGG
jgi:hypothetical protein